MTKNINILKSRFESHILMSTGQVGRVRSERESVSERGVPSLMLLQGGLVRPGGRCVSVDVGTHLLSGPKVGTLCTHPSFIVWRSATVLMALSISKV